MKYWIRTVISKREEGRPWRTFMAVCLTDNPRSHDNGITICMNAYRWMWVYICYTAFELSKEGYDKTLSYKGFEKALENVAHEMYRNGLYLHHISPSDEYNVISDVAMNQIKPRSPNIRSKSSRINWKCWSNGAPNCRKRRKPEAGGLWPPGNIEGISRCNVKGISVYIMCGKQFLL